MEKRIGDTAFFISLPNDHTVEARPGPDFSVYYFLPIVNEASGRAGLYIGGHPQKFYDKEGFTRLHYSRHAFLDKTENWKVSVSSDNTYHAELIVELSKFEKIHAFISAGTLEAIERWLVTFETLRKKTEVTTKPKAIVVSDKNVVLYDLKTQNLNVNVIAYFENGCLVIDGCDSGERVRETFGDSDHEYKLTVDKNDLPELFRLLQIERSETEEVLQVLKSRFAGENCFRNIRDLMDDHKLKYDYFSWS